jgi:hypothetical protein
VFIGNDSAQKAYEKAGYVVVEEKTHADFEAVYKTPGSDTASGIVGTAGQTRPTREFARPLLAPAPSPFRSMPQPQILREEAPHRRPVLSRSG